MNIVKYNHRLNVSELTPINPNNFNAIAVHHMDHLTGNLNDVTSWHMDGNHWVWVGYNFWIGFDGTIYECRGINYLPAAVLNHNNHVLSIGFQGQYNQNNKMPDAQFNSGVELIKYLKSKLPNIKTVAGHRDFMNSTCPGKYFPLDKMIEEVNKVETNSIDEEFKANLEILKSYTQINSVDYWLDNAVKGGKCEGEYVKILLNKFAEFFKNHPM